MFVNKCLLISNVNVLKNYLLKSFAFSTVNNPKSVFCWNLREFIFMTFTLLYITYTHYILYTHLYTPVIIK